MAATLHDLIDALPNLSSRSNTKFQHVSAWLATALGEPDVAVVYVDAPKNLKNRATQRGVASRFLFVVTPVESLGGCLNTTRTQRLVGPGSPAGVLAFVTRSTAGEWTVSHIVHTAGSPSIAGLKRLFPNSEVVEVSLPSAHPNASLEPLAEALCVGQDWLEEVAWCLDDRGKSGVVFYGPPGTAKTYVATRIAEFRQPKAAHRRLVQMHPAFGYEEFVEGYRPVPGTAGLALAKVDGPLRDLVRNAGDEQPLLVIDELNRANVPKVFGELLFALEYRDRPVRLMYSPDDDFVLPAKFRILATMNTADRSVAVIDQALRRRFHFIPMFPDEAPVSGMLRTWLARHRPAMDWVVDLLDEANARLGNRHAAIGPSHFMRLDLDEIVLDRVWRFSVLPTIEDQFFGDEDRLDDFDLDRLRTAVAAKR